jgi:predicted metalloprotease
VGTTGELQTTPQEERMVDFVDAVAGDTQDAWQQVLGGRYQRTQVVLFRDGIDSACGFAQSATGPFYCPRDQKVYLDLGFFRELSERFGATGDFAQAYVIAHEFGHHVQHITGLTARVEQSPRPGATSASVALELQADCFAGIWGHSASQQGRFEAGGVELEPGDAEEALRAAAAIGDDRLQRMSTGRVAPERFTHGTSAQRMDWFRRGFESGDPNRCDAFAALTQ